MHELPREDLIHLRVVTVFVFLEPVAAPTVEVGDPPEGVGLNVLIVLRRPLFAPEVVVRMGHRGTEVVRKPLELPSRR